MLGPEAKVKAKVKKHLAYCNFFTYWPVPSGYGQQMVDCLAWAEGKTLAIECKREGINKPTPRQAAIMRALRQHGVMTYVVTIRDGELLWLEQKD